MKNKHENFNLLRAFLRGNLMGYAGAVLCMALGLAASFLSPLLLSETIDAIIGDVRPLNLPAFVMRWVESRGGRVFLANNLWIPALTLMALYLAGGIFEYLRGRLAAQSSEAIAQKMRNRLYDHLQRLPYDYHVKARTGDLIQRCTSDVETVRRFLSTQLVEIFRTALMIAAAAAVMSRINGTLTLISMCVTPVLFLMGLFFFKWVNRFFLAFDEAEGHMSAVLQENLAGARVVRAFGRQRYELDKFKAANDELHARGKRLSDLMAAFWPLGDLLSMTQTCLTIVAAIAIAAKGELTVGEATVFVTYVGMLLTPIRRLGRILADFGKSMVSLSRIREILETPAEPAQAAPVKPPLDGDVVFDHVAFAYDKNSPVLVDMNFTAKAGQTVAILGATGSGKSTMVHLLQRLYAPDAGRITIGGVDIQTIDRAYLRARVGLILQEPFLYSRTLGENIALAGDHPTQAEIDQAARIACCTEFVQGFEKGYDTVVGERGVTLSGGQKQRVAIARTLLKDSDILIFDDSLSAVDTQTDAKIRAALADRRGKKTTFIISHRLTTLSWADQILVLKNGRVAQSGTHGELIHQDGLYRRIYRIQGALEDEMRGEEA